MKISSDIFNLKIRDISLCLTKYLYSINIYRRELETGGTVVSTLLPSES